MLLWLRAAGLVGQAVALGSAVFALVVLRRDPERRPARALDWTLALTGAGALVAVLAQTGLLAVLAAALADDAGWPIAALLGSTVGIAGIVRIAAGLAILSAAIALRRAPASRLPGALLLGSTILLSATGALASHAMGRLDGQAWLLTVTAFHQAAVGIWVGGLICAAMLLLRADVSAGDVWLRPFSVVAAAAVVGIAVTGVALSLAYVATPGAAIGTSYGAMVLTKIVLFVALLAMGVLNHRALHGRLALGPWSSQRSTSGGSSILLRRRLEVEAGLAVVTVLLAASIGSAPPAVDVGVRQEQHAAPDGDDGEDVAPRGIRVAAAPHPPFREPEERSEDEQDPVLDDLRAQEMLPEADRPGLPSLRIHAVGDEARQRNDEQRPVPSPRRPPGPLERREDPHGEHEEACDVVSELGPCGDLGGARRVWIGRASCRERVLVTV